MKWPHFRAEFVHTCSGLNTGVATLQESRLEESSLQAHSRKVLTSAVIQVNFHYSGHLSWS